MGNALDKLTIKGFKSIKSLDDFELKNLNVMIGGNGAGKSNFVDFFRMLREMMSDNLRDYINNKSGGISDLLFNGRKFTAKMEFKMIFGLRGYRFNIVPSVKGDFSITNEARYYKHGITGWWEFGDSPDGKSLLAKEVKNKEPNEQYGKYVFDAITSWQIYHFHDTSSTAAMRHEEIIQDNMRLRPDASNIAPFLLKLKEEEHEYYKAVIEAVRLVTPFFDDFILKSVRKGKMGEKEKVNLSWRQKGSDYPMQPYHFSDGTIRFICLATALLQPEPPSAILIDEPELGLHPYAIEILAELIKSTSKKTQVIVSTQSPALIDNFTPEDIIIVNREDGASTFKRLDAKELSHWLEEYSLGELWRKNIVAGGPTHE
jgi:predicted ATPase